MLFEIYAGLSGGFGGASHQETDEFNSEEEALEYAYHLAIEEYQSYEGCHGILDWLDCREDLIKSGFSYMMMMLMLVIKRRSKVGLSIMSSLRKMNK